MDDVTLILPKDMKALEDKYAEILANVIGEMLNITELEYLISELEREINFVCDFPARNLIKLF